MTSAQRKLNDIQGKQSELRSRLAVLASKETRTTEEESELTTVEGQLSGCEPELRAANGLSYGPKQVSLTFSGRLLVVLRSLEQPQNIVSRSEFRLLNTCRWRCSGARLPRHGPLHQGHR